MKELLIISGKGGTGKTTIAASFLRIDGYSTRKGKIAADCDADAPNLHLLLKPDSVPSTIPYYGFPTAAIDMKCCIGCGRCERNCRFQAIERGKDGKMSVDPYACEGCGVCVLVCPVSGIRMINGISGRTKLYRKENKSFVTAELEPGSGATGKLVTEVKQHLRNEKARLSDPELVIIDGSPGIGCPVIASLSGVDIALIVTEPSLSGLSDLKRIVATARFFGVLIIVCINKYDLHPDLTNRIVFYCRNEELPIVGLIPYDETVIDAVNSQKTVVDFDCPAGMAIREMYRKITELIRIHGEVK